MPTQADTTANWIHLHKANHRTENFQCSQYNEINVINVNRSSLSCVHLLCLCVTEDNRVCWPSARTLPMRASGNVRQVSESKKQLKSGAFFDVMSLGNWNMVFEFTLSYWSYSKLWTKLRHVRSTVNDSYRSSFDVVRCSGSMSLPTAVTSTVTVRCCLLFSFGQYNPEIYVVDRNE